MFTEVRNAVERVPVDAWAVPLALSTLPVGYRIASKSRTTNAPREPTVPAGGDLHQGCLPRARPAPTA